MTRIREEGLYETLLPDITQAPPYRLRVTRHDGTVTEVHDPYAVPPLLTEYELHLFAEGTLYKAYESFGAHIRTIAGIRECSSWCGRLTPHVSASSETSMGGMDSATL